MIASLTGQDTVVVNGRVLTQFGDADHATLTFPNDLANLKVGKNGNTIYALNATGLVAEAVLRIIRGSDDDKFLNAALAAMLADFASFQLLTGQFVKRVGDGNQNITNDTYILAGGIFVKRPEAKSNVEGDTEQSLSIYNLRFSNTDRGIL